MLGAGGLRGPAVAVDADIAEVAALMTSTAIKSLPVIDDEGGTVSISSETFPGTGGVLGLTKIQLVEAVFTYVPYFMHNPWAQADHQPRSDKLDDDNPWAS